MSVAEPTSLRIALIIHALQGGGAERLMSQLASRWAEAGHGVHLITLAPVESDAYPLDARVVRHSLDLMRQSQSRLDGALANLRRVQRLRRQLTAVAPDFILSFCDRMNIVTASAAARLKVPVWLAEHSDPRKQYLGLPWETWRSLAYRRASGCVVLSEPIAEWMRGRFPKLPLEVIPPAISPPRPAPTQPEPGRARRLLALGRHSPEKNMLGLLAAWQLLAGEFSQWQLVIAGDGPQHAQLLQQRDALGLGDRVAFTGWISDPWSLIASCDALVLPSHYEGFPVTLLEAMSMGLACVSTPSCDSVQALAAAGAVELARSAEPVELAAAIGKLLRSPQRRAELGAAARVLAAQYDWSAIGPRWDRLLARSVG